MKINLPENLDNKKGLKVKKKFGPEIFQISHFTIYFIMFIINDMTKKKSYLCSCGESDPDKFYKTNKSKCKECFKIYYQENKKAFKDRYRQNCEGLLDYQKKWQSNNLVHFRVQSAKHRAKRKGLTFELTDEIIYEKIKEQKGKCYISQMNLSYIPDDWCSISLDRLDNNKGYTIENTIVVTKFVNQSKSTLTIEEFGGHVKGLYKGFILENPHIWMELLPPN